MAIWYDPLSYIDIVQVYLANPYLFDALILLSIFLGITQFVFTKKEHFGKKNGKTLSVAISFALTFSTVLFMYNRGWNLATPGIGIIPMTILFAILYYLLYTVFHEIIGMETMCAGSLAFLITYPGVQALFGDPQTSIAARYPALGMLFSLMILVAAIALIICATRLFSGGGNSTENTRTAREEEPAYGERLGDDLPESAGTQEDDDQPQEVQPPIFAEPSGPYTQDDQRIPLDIRLDANHHWILQVSHSGERQQGTGDHITGHVQNPGVGNHVVILTIYQEQTQHQFTCEFTVEPSQRQESLELRGQAIVVHEDGQHHLARGAVLQLLRQTAGGNFEFVGEENGQTRAGRINAHFRFDVPNEQAVYRIQGVWEHNGRTYRGEIDPQSSGLRQREDQPWVVVRENEQPPEVLVVLETEEEENDNFEITIDKPNGTYYEDEDIPVRISLSGGSGTYDTVYAIENQQGRRSSEESIQDSLPNPGVGEHTLQVVAVSGQEQRTKEQEFTVRKRKKKQKKPKQTTTDETAEIVVRPGYSNAESTTENINGVVYPGISFPDALSNQTQINFAINANITGTQYIQYSFGLVLEAADGRKGWCDENDLNRVSLRILGIERGNDFGELPAEIRSSNDQAWFVSDPIRPNVRDSEHTVKLQLGNAEDQSLFSLLDVSTNMHISKVHFILLVTAHGTKTDGFPRLEVKDQKTTYTRVTILRPEDS